MITTAAIVGLVENNKVIGLRLLVFKKGVPEENRLAICSKLGNISTDYATVLKLCNPQIIGLLDYHSPRIPQLLQEWGITHLLFEDIKSDMFIGYKVMRYSSEQLPKFLDFIKLYDNRTIIKPSIVKSVINYEVAFDIAPSAIKYLYVNRVPFCSFNPIDKPRSFSDLHFRVEDNILVYSSIKTVYILQQFSIRHRPVPLGEELTVNLNSGLCLKKVARITDSEYINALYRFDTVHKGWITCKIIERCPIDGYKRVK